MTTPQKFQLPAWMAQAMQENSSEVQWYSEELIDHEFNNPKGLETVAMPMYDEAVEMEVNLWNQMVPVADGPSYTDRVGRTEKSRIYVMRKNPDMFLLSIGEKHPPSLWVAAGTTTAELEDRFSTYFKTSNPAQSEQPLQGLLYLSNVTQVCFDDIERSVTGSPFTDMHPWGSSQQAAPYPEKIELGRLEQTFGLTYSKVRELMAQKPGELTSFCLRTRYSRSIVKLIDVNDIFFAELYFKPAEPELWTQVRNGTFGNDFPAKTPVDVVGALSGLSCWGEARIRRLYEDSTHESNRSLIREILAYYDHVVMANDSDENEALAAAKSWLSSVDKAEYGQSWEQAAELFKSAVKKEQFVVSLEASRGAMGQVSLRTVKSRQFARSLPGAPDGEYLVIQFDTSFEKKAAATETVTPMREKDGTWKVSGYYIR